MVWIILIAVVVVVAGLVALAWWSSGRARGIRHQQARDLTEAERNVHYQSNQSRGYHAGGSGFSL
jgi:hypothetical protein